MTARRERRVRRAANVYRRHLRGCGVELGRARVSARGVAYAGLAVLWWHRTLLWRASLLRRRRRAW